MKIELTREMTASEAFAISQVGFEKSLFEEIASVAKMGFSAVTIFRVEEFERANLREKFEKLGYGVEYVEKSKKGWPRNVYRISWEKGGEV